METGVRPARIAFCGASGTGKTLLSDWIEKTYGLPINPVGARSVVAAMGLSSTYDPEVNGRRTEFQLRLIQEKIAWEAEHDTFVADRTTFDVLVNSMLHDAQQVTAQMFDLACQGMSRYQYVIYCPVAVYINMDGDPARLDDLTYHRLFDATLWGILQKFRPPEVRLVTLPFPLLQHRKDFVAALFSPDKPRPRIVPAGSSAQ